MADHGPPSPVVLVEEEYVASMAAIVERDFYPELSATRARLALLEAQRRGDVAAAVNAQRQLAHLRDGGDADPQAPNESLDAFAAKYTSEDNASYAKLAAVEAARNRAKRKWATQLHNGALGDVRRPGMADDDARGTDAFALPPPPARLALPPAQTAAQRRRVVAAANTRFAASGGAALGWAPPSTASSAVSTPASSCAPHTGGGHDISPSRPQSLHRLLTTPVRCADGSGDGGAAPSYGIPPERARERAARTLGGTPAAGTPYLRGSASLASTPGRGVGTPSASAGGRLATPRRLSAAAEALMRRAHRGGGGGGSDWQLESSYGGGGTPRR